MPDVHAAYVGSNDYWGYDSDTFNEENQFFGSSWVVKSSKVTDKKISEDNLNRCALYYEIGKTDSHLFTPTTLAYNADADFLLVTGEQGTIGESSRTETRRKAYSLGEKAQRVRSMTDGPESRGVGRFEVDYIVVSDDSDVANIQSFIEDLDSDEEVVEAAAESFEADVTRTTKDGITYKIRKPQEEFKGYNQAARHHRQSNAGGLIWNDLKKDWEKMAEDYQAESFEAENLKCDLCGGTDLKRIENDAGQVFYYCMNQDSPYGSCYDKSYGGAEGKWIMPNGMHYNGVVKYIENPESAYLDNACPRCGQWFSVSDANTWEHCDDCYDEDYDAESFEADEASAEEFGAENLNRINPVAIEGAEDIHGAESLSSSEGHLFNMEGADQDYMEDWHNAEGRVIGQDYEGYETGQEAAAEDDTNQDYMEDWNADDISHVIHHSEQGAIEVHTTSGSIFLADIETGAIMHDSAGFSAEDSEVLNSEDISFLLDDATEEMGDYSFVDDQTGEDPLAFDPTLAEHTDPLVAAEAENVVETIQETFSQIPIVKNFELGGWAASAIVVGVAGFTGWWLARK